MKKQKTLDEVLKARGEFIDEYKQAVADKLQQNRTRKLKIKSTENFNSQVPHTNFTEEIYTDKYLDYTSNIIYGLIVILAIVLVIVNL